MLNAPGRLTSSVINRRGRNSTAEFRDKMRGEESATRLKERLTMTPERWNAHLLLQITD